MWRFRVNSNHHTHWNNLFHYSEWFTFVTIKWLIFISIVINFESEKLEHWELDKSRRIKIAQGYRVEQSNLDLEFEIPPLAFISATHMSLSQSLIVPCPPIHLVSHPNPPFWGELHLLRRFLCPKISLPLRTGKWSWVNLQVRISPCLEVQGTGLPPAALLLQETPSFLPALENQDIFISLFILREPMSFFF